MDAIYFLVFIGLLLAVGYRLAVWRTRRDRDRLAELRQMVNGEMEAMYQVYRIHDAFVDARDQLRRQRPVQVPPADRSYIREDE